LTKTISSSDLTEPVEVNDVQCGDVVRSTIEMLLPVAIRENPWSDTILCVSQEVECGSLPLFPEPVTFRFFSIVSHRSIGIRSALEVEIDELFQISSDDPASEDDLELVSSQAQKRKADETH
jgi:hypothetical protein